MEPPEVGSGRDLAKIFSNRNLPPHGEVSLLWRALNLAEPPPTRRSFVVVARPQPCQTATATVPTASTHG
ncbi:MAG: hypothetical protein EAZ93_22290 [Oscillatoriales cyanobacterium]|nr:MAG: hypothetical protein EAZ93_22290 [Oscillatoriales cyanobacterium]